VTCRWRPSDRLPEVCLLASQGWQNAAKPSGHEATGRESLRKKDDVFNDVDASLAAFLSDEALPGAGISIAFEPPTREWASRRTAPVLNCFLVDVREDLERRTTTLTEVRDETGRTVSRAPAPRIFRITYLVTAWTAVPEDDHRLLGSALIALLRHDVVQPTHARGYVADLVSEGRPPAIRVGGLGLSERTVAEVWAALDADYRPCIPVAYLLPLPAGEEEKAGPPQTQPPRLTVSDEERTETILGRDPVPVEASARTRLRGGTVQPVAPGDKR